MKFSESYPIKESGTASSIESVLDPALTNLENNIINITGEGVYTYETKSVAIDGITKTYYQQYIRSEVIGAVNNIWPGFALDSNNYAWAWGYNNGGQCGDGTINHRSSPVSVLGGKQFVSIALSPELSTAMLGLTDDGNLWAWGTNNNGQCGDGTINHRSSPVSVLGDRLFVSISRGQTVSYAIDYLGYAWAWGLGTSGRIGDNSGSISRSSPVSVVGGYRFCAVGGGCGIDFNNNVKAWGDNFYGQLGVGDTTNRGSPVSVLGLSNVVRIVSGQYHSVYLLKDGSIWTCGANTTGQLGDNSTNNRSSPVSVNSARRFVDIAAGSSHTLALDIDGYVWTWGSNTYGQLGLGDTVFRSIPESIGTNRYIMIAARISSTALDTNGLLWAWGSNTNGALGTGDTVSQSRPTAVILSANQTWKTRKGY